MDGGAEWIHDHTRAVNVRAEVTRTRSDAADSVQYGALERSCARSDTFAPNIRAVLLDVPEGLGRLLTHPRGVRRLFPVAGFANQSDLPGLRLPFNVHETMAVGYEAPHRHAVSDGGWLGRRRALGRSHAAGRWVVAKEQTELTPGGGR